MNQAPYYNCLGLIYLLFYFDDPSRLAPQHEQYLIGENQLKLYSVAPHDGQNFVKRMFRKLIRATAGKTKSNTQGSPLITRVGISLDTGWLALASARPAPHTAQASYARPPCRGGSQTRSYSSSISCLISHNSGYYCRCSWMGRYSW